MSERSVDGATQAMLEKAWAENITLVWDRLKGQEPQCEFGTLGVCCRSCNMGPCHIHHAGRSREGVCGATRDTIVARNLLRTIAGGAAAHSEHGRTMALTLYRTARGELRGYQIKDTAKLRLLAAELGVPVEARPPEDIALDVSRLLLEEFGSIKGRLAFLRRAPEKRRERWARLGITPRGIDREIVESLHRTTMGVDNDYVSLILQGMRTALSDGWGGSTVATELSDILFGTPRPVKGRSNLGVLRVDQVNIVLHGHEPVLSDAVVSAARDAELLNLARRLGATGINVCGMCCTGNEILMRHGIPIAGNFLQQELAIVTGAVEAMVVDVQCIMPGLAQAARCFHTKLISTSPKAKFPGAEHIEFDERNAVDAARRIVCAAVENFPNRQPAGVDIPSEAVEYVAGFSVEAILALLGGSPEPLVEAVKSGRLKGIAALVGCNNPKIRHDYGHLALARRLIAEDVLVVTTGCAAIACAKDGLLRRAAAAEAGAGLRKACETLGIPPVLHMGSCVDISRILRLAAVLADALGVDISDLPVVAAAPEWMSEKAVSIGTYAVASGIQTILGTVPAVLGSANVTGFLTAGVRNTVGAAFAVEEDPEKAAGLALAHIAAKRSALGL